ncbi:hypothetical protein [Erwinia sp.]|nr:hypothetical protein [Erwinia sp.]
MIEKISCDGQEYAASNSAGYVVGDQSVIKPNGLHKKALTSSIALQNP